MDPKQKQLLIAVGAVCGLIVLALAYFLFSAIGENADAKAARDRYARNLRSSNLAEPYPSRANRDVRLADAANAEKEIAAAKALLAKGNDVIALPADQTSSPSKFTEAIGRGVSELAQRQETPAAQRLRAAASQAQQAVMSYSFERYVQGDLPKEADIARLARQFATIRHVCDTLLDSGAVLITDVQRTRFDAAAEAEEEQPTTRRRRASRRAEPVAQAADAYGLLPAPVAKLLAEDGVDRESYAVTFRAPYSAVAKTLNALAEDPLFVVVTDLSVSSAGLVEAKVDDLVKKRRTTRNSALTRARSAENAERAEELAKRGLFEGVAIDQRLVTDPETAEPLQVTLRFDVYTAPAPAEPAPAPAKEGN